MQTFDRGDAFNRYFANRNKFYSQLADLATPHGPGGVLYHFSTSIAEIATGNEADLIYLQIYDDTITIFKATRGMIQHILEVEARY